MAASAWSRVACRARSATCCAPRCSRCSTSAWTRCNGASSPSCARPKHWMPRRCLQAMPPWPRSISVSWCCDSRRAAIRCPNCMQPMAVPAHASRDKGCHGPCGVSSATCSRRSDSVSRGTSTATARRSTLLRAIASTPSTARAGCSAIVARTTATARRPAAPCWRWRQMPCPDAEDLAGLRRALRPVLEHHLDGRGLKSWDMLAELGRITPRPS